MPRLSRLFLCLLLGALFCGSAAAIGVGQPAPDFPFLQSWGVPTGKQKLSDFRGSVVLLEVWATWCEPCVASIPHLREISSVYAPQGLCIVSVSGEDAAKIEPFIKQHNMNYPVVRAEGIASLYGTEMIPKAWLIGKDGIVVWDGNPMEVDSGTVTAALNGKLGLKPRGDSDASPSDMAWWVWLIVLPGLLFAGALGWFFWRTRDRTTFTPQPVQPNPPPAPPQPPQPPPPPQQPPPPPRDGQFPAYDTNRNRPGNPYR